MMLWDVTRDQIRPYFPGTVPGLWIKKSSVLVFFSKSLNVNISDKEYESFYFFRGGNLTGCCVMGWLAERGITTCNAALSIVPCISRKFIVPTLSSRVNKLLSNKVNVN